MYKWILKRFLNSVSKTGSWLARNRRISLQKLDAASKQNTTAVYDDRTQNYKLLQNFGISQPNKYTHAYTEHYVRP